MFGAWWRQHKRQRVPALPTGQEPDPVLPLPPGELRVGQSISSGRGQGRGPGPRVKICAQMCPDPHGR